MKRHLQSTGSAVVETDDRDEIAVEQRPGVSRRGTDGSPGSPSIVRLDGFDLNGQPLVTGVPGLEGEIILAYSTTVLSRDAIGRRAVVLFEQNDIRRPIIVGLIQESPMDPATRTGPTIVATPDDGRLVLSAEREITLRCGAATVTLTSAGKVLIHGVYVSSRASGVNRIRGGAVQIN